MEGWCQNMEREAEENELPEEGEERGRMGGGGMLDEGWGLSERGLSYRKDGLV